MRAALHFSSRPWVMAAGLAAITSMAGSSAHAESSNVPAAEALFRDGKERMAAKDYAAACPKLAESFRLDAATGTLLALAICHEREGKLASAWAEYSDAAARSKREARTDREKAARDKAGSLEPKLSHLTLVVDRTMSETPGFEVKRNGVVFGAGTLGTAMPVDGGSYSIEVAAPQKKPWRAKINVAASGDKQTITVPTLQDDVKEAVAAEPKARKLPPIEGGAKPAVASHDATPRLLVDPARDAADGAPRFNWTAATTIGAGVVGLGVGTVFLLRAVAKNEESKEGCNGDRCTPDAKDARLDARDFGKIATVGFAAGGALVAAGVTIHLLSRPTRTPARAATVALDTAPLLVLAGFGAQLQGRF